MNSEITAFARGSKCGGFGAYGLSPSGLAEHALADVGRKQTLLSSALRQRDAADAAARSPQKIRDATRNISCCARRHLM